MLLVVRCTPPPDPVCMKSENPLELDAGTMRAMGYRIVDHLVERISALDHDAAWRGASRADLHARMAEPAPESPRGFDASFERLRADVLPFAARVDHPRFLAFVPGAGTWPGILADFLAAGHNLFQGTWLGGAGPSEVELVVLDWFRDWIGMPAGAGGLFTSGGSAATLIAIAAARQLRFGGHDARAIVYRSAECHSSVDRALRFLGFAPDQVRTVAVDAQFRMQPASLEDLIARDAESGRIPFLIIANAGTTSTGAIDPLADLAAIRSRHSLWLHTDGAYGGFAVLSDRGRRLLDGIGEADSVTLDPHKWLYQPFEAGCLMVRDVARLEAAFRLVPDYLKDAELTGEDPLREANFTDRGFQLTRQARALKVWLSVQTFGLAAFRDAIDRTLDLARHTEERVRASSSLEMTSPASLGIVCFRRRDPGVDDEAEIERRNMLLIRRLADSGDGMISSTRVNGRLTLRTCVLNHRTRLDDVERVIDWLELQRVD
jgi:aromatic-L-amino-acid/L-tryptophan decarboxylase